MGNSKIEDLNNYKNSSWLMLFCTGINRAIRFKAVATLSDRAFWGDSRNERRSFRALIIRTSIAALDDLKMAARKIAEQKTHNKNTGRLV